MAACSMVECGVTGYYIKFKALKDINVEVLEAAISYGFKATAVTSKKT